MSAVTLRCECGSLALSITEQFYPDDPAARATEHYQCDDCGRNGTYSFGGDLPDQTTGCVQSGHGEVITGP